MKQTLLVAICLLPFGCATADSTLDQPDPPVIAPPNEAFVAVRDAAPDVLIDGTRVDLTACPYGRWFEYLPFGTAWWLMHPREDGLCELWLGGEMENPSYRGEPTQYCLFRRQGSVQVEENALGGGPAHIDSARCISMRPSFV